jgi:hypothetical protein
MYIVLTVTRCTRQHGAIGIFDGRAITSTQHIPGERLIDAICENFDDAVDGNPGVEFGSIIHATITRDGQVTRIGGRDMPEVL